MQAVAESEYLSAVFWLEKQDGIEEKREKIVYLPAGTGTTLEKFNESLENSWQIVQISPCEEGSHIWLREK